MNWQQTRHDGSNGGSAQDALTPWLNLPADDTVFCPMSGWDLTPLLLAGDLASVFVFADWRFGAEVFDKGIWPDIKAGKYDGLYPGDVDAENPVIALPDEEVRKLSGPSSDFAIFDEPAWVPGAQPWCRIAQVNRSANRAQQALRLVYMVGNCVEIYQHLFIERGAAPKILWLEWPLGADDERWEHFVSTTGEFGRIFTRATPQPRYVVAHHHQPGWQHTVPYRRFKAWHPAWDLTAFSRPDAAHERDVEKQPWKP